MEQKANSGMSKKAALAGIAISSIAASDNWTTQAFIAGVVIVAIVVQAVLDWRKGSNESSSDRS